MINHQQLCVLRSPSTSLPWIAITDLALLICALLWDLWDLRNATTCVVVLIVFRLLIASDLCGLFARGTVLAEYEQ